MALSYGFYNSMGGDRRYNAVQISELFDGLITDGVFSSIDDILATVPGEGLQVIVKSGRAWFNHTWNKNDAPVPFNLATPDMTLSRFDTIVLEVNSDISVRANKFAVVKGTPATTPQKPALIDTETLHQHPLAYVRVRGGATQIEQTDIEILVGKDECPFTTGILTSASIEDLFQQWEGDFYAWWDTIKTTLDENIVTNLLNMIDQCVKISDRATNEEVLAGADNTKWVSAASVKNTATNIFDNIMTSTTRTVKLSNSLTTATALSIEIPFGRPITDFEELNISVAGIKNSQAFRVRLNNISEACYMRGTSASLQKYCISIGNTSTDKQNILTMKLIPSRPDDFYYNYVTGQSQFGRIHPTTQSAITAEPFIYDPLLGGVDPSDITYITITTDNMTNGFAPGVQISAWGVLREAGDVLDIPVTEQPYMPGWTEFVEDINTTTLDSSLFALGSALGRAQVFTANGTFVASAGIKYKVVAGSGGGSGRGGRVDYNSSTKEITIESGGAGSPGIIRSKYLIFPTDFLLPITIGAGGEAAQTLTGGTYGNSLTSSVGKAGGTTSIGKFLSIPGGGGGQTYSGQISTTVSQQITHTFDIPGAIGTAPYVGHDGKIYGRGGNGSSARYSMAFYSSEYMNGWISSTFSNHYGNGSAMGPSSGFVYIFW